MTIEQIIEAFEGKTDRHLLHQVLLEFHFLNIKIDKIMSEQDSINADVAAIKAVFDKIGADLTTINAGIAALQAQIASGATVDTTALDALVAQGQALQGTVDSAAASLPAPSTPTDSTTGATAP